MPFTHKDFEFIDAHSHFFPPQIFKAIWEFFEKTDEKGNIQGCLTIIIQNLLSYTCFQSHK